MTTYTGKNLETALQKAAQATGTSVEALKYEILAGKTGGYALIKVTGAAAAVAAPAAPLVESLSGDPNAPDTERREARGGRDRGDRGDRGGDRGGRRDDRGPRGDRGGDRGAGGDRPRRDDRGGRDDRGPRGDRGDRGGDRGGRGGDRGDRPRRREDREELPPIPSDGPSVVTVEVEGELSAFGRRTEEVLVGLLERMGFGVKVKLAETADEIVADLHSGPYHEALVARELELLDAIELLLEKTVRLPDEADEAGRGEGEGEGEGGRTPRKKIHLDTNGHRAKADLDLAHSARHMADRAIDERRVFKIGPLDPRARRVVHMTLKEVPGVITKSEGEGVFRRVCIIPKSVEPVADDSQSEPSDDE